MLATLTAKELEMLRTISQDDLAPPPSQEDIFGQIDAVKKQFEEDHELIALRMSCPTHSRRQKRIALRAACQYRIV